MKFLAIVLVAVLIQSAYSQKICAAAPRVIAAPVVAQPSVANTLADTLSLLTVSSLLAETLPLNPNVVATVPMPVAAPAYAPAVSYGCGCGCNSGRYGYSYVY